MLITRTPRLLAAVVVASALALGLVFVADASNPGHGQGHSSHGKGHATIARVRAAVAHFHRVETARSAGWDLVPGLDHCFESDAGGMGVHYINTGLLMDTTLDPRQPEALVYQHRPNGKLRLGAVEYIVPADLWDAEGHSGPPRVLGHDLHLNSDLGVYVLHAWIFTYNPAGTFEDWNPRVSCPD